MRCGLLSTVILAAIITAAPTAQSITSPNQKFGFELGSDYQLIT